MRPRVGGWDKGSEECGRERSWFRRLCETKPRSVPDEAGGGGGLTVDCG